MNNKEPLGLPKGSVRAIPALMIVGSILGRLVAGMSVDDREFALLAAVTAGYGLYRLTEEKKD